MAVRLGGGWAFFFFFFFRRKIVFLVFYISNLSLSSKSIINQMTSVCALFFDTGVEGDEFVYGSPPGSEGVTSSIILHGVRGPLTISVGSFFGPERRDNPVLFCE